MDQIVNGFIMFLVMATIMLSALVKVYQLASLIYETSAEIFNLIDHDSFIPPMQKS